MDHLFSLEELAEMGYREPRILPATGEQAALHQFMFTWAILSDFTSHGYNERWCYASYEKAKQALLAWDGQGEPTGWHRHPATGRRIAEDGTLSINF